MNRNTEREERRPTPGSKGSFVSKLMYFFIFQWLKPILKLGRSFGDKDIYAVKQSMQSDQNTEEFVQLWQLEMKKKRPSILRVILKIHGCKVFTLGLLYSLGETFARVIQPICLGAVVDFVSKHGSDSENKLSDACWYASGIVFSTALTTITFYPFCVFLIKTSCKVRVACSGLIFEKSLKIRKSSAMDGQNGQIINMLSNDLSKFDNAITVFHNVWKSPLEALIFFIVIYMEIGPSAIIGIAFLISFIPLQAYISKKAAVLRMKNTKKTDIRVKIMNEILLGVQVIKMYAWEKSFIKLVDKIRRNETSVIRLISYIRATINSFTMIPKVSVFLSLIAYVYFGNVFTARKAFIVASYFTTLNLSMVHIWPLALMFTAEAYISIKRLQEFLLRSECKEGSKGSDTESDNEELDRFVLPRSPLSKRIQTINILKKPVVRLDNVTAVWEQSKCHQENGIIEMDLEIKPGLCAIVGQVGSGKSSLLNVILGELDVDEGLALINGTISYASQEPWIFEGTIRNNIVFVEDFDEERYKQVVEVCALERDFALMPYGDATTVGEAGSSLSGGQKARVNLARAIYKRSDIYLLDDPLSAVDSHVGKHIFERCFKEFLAGKICVLVTHQLQYLKRVEHVVLMKGGRIAAQGPFRTLEKFNKESLIHAQEEEEQNTPESSQKRAILKTQISTAHSAEPVHEIETKYSQIDRKEQQAAGSVKFSTYKSYFKAAHNNATVMIVFVVFVVSQVFWSGSDVFFSQWVRWEDNISVCESNQTSNEQSEERNNYLMIYTCMMLVGIVGYIVRSFAFFRLCLKISINMHNMIFCGITRAKMSFFNANPSGRIVNRFARDINNIDALVPNVMIDVMTCVLSYLAVVINVAIANPLLLIPSLIMTMLLYLLRGVFINTGRSLTRIEALSRSSLFAYMNASLQGSATIRSCNASKILQKEFFELQDHNTSAWYLSMCASRWLGLCLDMVCFLYITFVTFYLVLFGDTMEMDSGKVGLAISSSISLIGFCQWGMRQSAELEQQMISVERINEYADLPSERPLESDSKNAPPQNWPQNGNIEFRSLNMRYAESSPCTLQNLSLSIKAKEKVGVVGRTGAGKSSIIQSLFCLAQNEGQILIDDVDIGAIGLHDLRKKISIIPQEAVLFSGSLRFNLDPFEERTDDELWSSLEQVELKTTVSSMPGGIDCKVLDGGSNFSAGQRQLLCLARAILRKNKILILDEATANVDVDTDKLIQDTIRSRFADCTVITIAHRLNTVMDSDKVLVMDAGRAVEFDHPFKLAQKSDGIFRGLLNQTGSSIATALTLIAKQNYERSEQISQ